MKSVIIDSRMSEICKRRLAALGFYTIELPPCPTLPEAICAHPDTLICRMERELFVTADFCDTAAYVFSDIRERHPDIKISFTSDRLGNSYPDDCILNALVLGGDIYIKRDTAAGAVVRRGEELGYNVINTRQGYPACTTLAACGARGAFAVTADTGMAKVLAERGVSVTAIRSGSISLPPYEYGFIGGASGVLEDKIYFIGDIHSHPDCELILSAARTAGFECISLSDEPLADNGGMIFLN